MHSCNTTNTSFLLLIILQNKTRRKNRRRSSRRRNGIGEQTVDGKRRHRGEVGGQTAEKMKSKLTISRKKLEQMMFQSMGRKGEEVEVEGGGGEVRAA